MEGGRENRGGGRGSEPISELPWRRYRGRSRDEILGLARRYGRTSLVLWIAAGVLFVVATLSLVPGFGPEQNVAIVIVVFVLAIAALMTTSVWTWMDRAAHGEPRLDAQWRKWESSSVLIHLLVEYPARVLVGAIIAVLAIFGLLGSIPALLATAGALILVLVLLLVRDRWRRQHS